MISLPWRPSSVFASFWVLLDFFFFYIMPANKNDGQMLSHGGVRLKNPVFSQGQLCIAVLWVISKCRLRIFIDSEGGTCTDDMWNNVCLEVFSAACPAALLL